MTRSIARRTTAAVLTAVLGAAVLGGCSNTPTEAPMALQTPTATATPTDPGTPAPEYVPPTAPVEDEQPTVAPEDQVPSVAGLPVQLPADQVDTPTGPGVNAFTPEDIRGATSFAASFVAAAAYDYNVWSRVVEGEEPPAEQYAWPAEHMTPTAKKWWYILTADAATIRRNLRDAGTRTRPGRSVRLYVIAPNVEPGEVYEYPAVRGAEYSAPRVEVGPKSDFDGRPTMRLTLTRTHRTYYSLNGEPHSWRTTWTHRFDLVRTGDPAQPWLIDRWVVPTLISDDRR